MENSCFVWFLDSSFFLETFKVSHHLTTFCGVNFIKCMLVSVQENPQYCFIFSNILYLWFWSVYPTKLLYQGFIAWVSVIALLRGQTTPTDLTKANGIQASALPLTCRSVTLCQSCDPLETPISLDITIPALIISREFLQDNRNKEPHVRVWMHLPACKMVCQGWGTSGARFPVQQQSGQGRGLWQP